MRLLRLTVTPAWAQFWERQQAGGNVRGSSNGTVRNARRGAVHLGHGLSWGAPLSDVAAETPQRPSSMP